MERVALYCRVSTEEQTRRGLSLAEQEHSLTEYAKEHKMKVVDTYIDAGISARKRYTKRPELLRLLEDIKAGKIDTILFIKLDRWFRSVGDYYEVQRILDQHKVAWRATQEDYETVTASGRFKVNIMLSVAQDEADRTSERIKFVFEGKRERGEVLNQNAPYGYRIKEKKLVLDEETAPIVRRMFDIYLATGSPAAVIDAVPERQLSYQLVWRILKKEVYAGNYHGYPVDPIITPEEHERVLKMMKAPVRKNSTNRIYIFSGLLRCQACGSRLKGRYVCAKGRSYFYYECANHAERRGCDQKKKAREDRIEDYLLDNINLKLSAWVKPKKQKPVSHEKERKAIIKKLSKLSELYINDLITMDDYRRQYDQLQDALAAIPADEVPKPENCEKAKAVFIKGWKDMYADLPREGKQQFWRGALEEITVCNGEVADFIFR